MLKKVYGAAQERAPDALDLIPFWMYPIDDHEGFDEMGLLDGIGFWLHRADVAEVEFPFGHRRRPLDAGVASASGGEDAPGLLQDAPDGPRGTGQAFIRQLRDAGQIVLDGFGIRDTLQVFGRVVADGEHVVDDLLTDAGRTGGGSGRR